jgi:hypothetical protein|tara:strand:- start:945 stop:1361 length:417 start_codon:yes stop_codon:yes gene_type:complete
MANLRVNLDTAVYSVLNVAAVTNEATGGVFNGIAPHSTTPPFVVFQAMSKLDEYWSFAGGRGGSAVYMVKAIDRSPWPKSAGDIDTQIDSVMQDASLSVTGHSLLSCRREEDVYLVEDQEGVIYQHVGGLYRITADQS